MRRVCGFLTAVLIWHLSLFSAGEAAALTGADVALYNDVSAPVSAQRGAWQSGVTAIKSMLTAMGYTYEEITYLDLSMRPRIFDALQGHPRARRVCPVVQLLDQQGRQAADQELRRRRRRFFGICAGAYFASDEVVWEGALYDDRAG